MMNELKLLYIEEDEIWLLWRESKSGISKIELSQCGEMTYVYNGNDGKKQRGSFGIDKFQEVLTRVLNQE